LPSRCKTHPPFQGKKRGGEGKVERARKGRGKRKRNGRKREKREI